MKEIEMQEVERAVIILITLIERQNLEEEKEQERRQQFKVVESIEDWKKRRKAKKYKDW